MCIRDRYYIYKLGIQNKSIIEHRYFDAKNVYDDGYFFDEAKHKVDMDILNNIDKDIPLIASPYEKKQGYHKLHEHPNSPIPFDVY